MRQAVAAAVILLATLVAQRQPVAAGMGLLVIHKLQAQQEQQTQAVAQVEQVAQQLVQQAQRAVAA
jgi:hypothetical protein